MEMVTSAFPGDLNSRMDSFIFSSNSLDIAPQKSEIFTEPSTYRKNNFEYSFKTFSAFGRKPVLINGLGGVNVPGNMPPLRCPSSFHAATCATLVPSG